MARKAEDTVVDWQAVPTTAIKNGLIMSTGDGKSLLQTHIHQSQQALGA